MPIGSHTYQGEVATEARPFLVFGKLVNDPRLYEGLIDLSKSLKSSVAVVFEGRRIDTGLRKFGAVVGDRADVGCNCVLNPGSIIGRRSMIYPTVNWRGVCAPDSVVKLRQEQQVIVRRK